ncbi:MAG: carbohydrate ABC transporter permease [Nevskiales bacterium]
MWWFMLPSFLVMAAVLLFPVGAAIYYSVLAFYLDGTPTHFVALQNYIELLRDDRFWGDLLNTVILVTCGVLLQLVIGLALALALFALKRGARSFLLLNFLPLVVTPVVGAIFLKWIFVSRWGLLDATLIAYDIFPPNWLGSPIWAMISLVLADTWKFMPFFMLVLYAGLQSFDMETLSAAAVDGANGWQRLRYIILPMMKPLILFVVAMRMMDAFRFFDLVYILTGGGPGSSTETITLYTYFIGFEKLDIGKSSALGVITVLIVSVLTAAIVYVVQRRGRQVL